MDHFDDEPLAFWTVYGRKTVERLHLRPGSTVLDVCCGTGASAIPAAQTVGLNGRVIGVDLAEKLLELGRKRAADLKLENIEFQTGDMENLEYPDNHFDAIDQLGKEAARRVEDVSLKWILDNHVDSVETNVIYAVGIK